MVEASWCVCVNYFYEKCVLTFGVENMVAIAHVRFRQASGSVDGEQPPLASPMCLGTIPTASLVWINAGERYLFMPWLSGRPLWSLWPMEGDNSEVLWWVTPYVTARQVTCLSRLVLRGGCLAASASPSIINNVLCLQWPKKQEKLFLACRVLQPPFTKTS